MGPRLRGDDNAESKRRVERPAVLISFQSSKSASAGKYEALRSSTVLPNRLSIPPAVVKYNGTSKGGTMKYFDVLVVIPLEEELIEFTKVFKTTDDHSTATDFRYGFKFPDSNISGLVVQQDEPGKRSAGRTVRSALTDFDAGLVVCLGIAGAMSNDMRLGDVCYTGDVIDVLENNKASNTPDGALEFEFSPDHFSTAREITAALNFMRTREDLRPSYLRWQEQQERMVRRSLGIPVIGRDGKEEELGAPKSKNGTIVCGPVSKSAALNKRLLGIDRKILAIETESGGIFEESDLRKIPALSIRGISDYADHTKNELEKVTGGRVRQIAACNAATFLAAQSENKYFLEIILNARTSHLNEPRPSGLQHRGAADVSVAVREIGQQIDAKLRELSPEYKLQPKGYRLPVPRIRSLEVNAGFGGPAPADPIEVRDALQNKNIVLLVIPRTYPDNSLPWILADDLLASEIGGKQTIPMVISGEDIKPPKGTLENIVSDALGIDILRQTDVQPVYIVEGIPFGSKSRASYIIDQVKEHPGAKFIFITRGDASLVKEDEFVGKLAAEVFSITQVSFREIAFFIQKNFEMTVPESEVIALRLRNTFKRFDLSAHPTYFAGIPRETLSALLQANRRSELIQLAVDGFLTFVVATDRADVALSRTTRSRFLRKLALAVNVEKKAFTQAELVEFTKSFSTQYDFDIDPLEFIHSFVERGILHFESDVVRFTLPFIEAYLLAVELKGDPSVANVYFQIEGQAFDFPTFDLYAEMGASSEFVSAIFDLLSKKLDYLRSARNAEHILLTDQVRPALLAQPDRVKALQDRINRAVEDVRKNRDDKERKQRLLDIADRIRETAAEQSGKGGRKEGANENERTDRLSAVLQVWSIGALLLGAGAEHLEAAPKQRLSKVLIEIAALAMDEWTQINSAVDFDEIKKTLTTTESIEKFIGDDTAAVTLDEARRTITGLVDILQYSFLGEPFRRIINHLCEHARLKVLAPSVEKSHVEGEVERVVFGAWLADIDGKRGGVALRDAIKTLPPAPFLRIILATHFLSRVYWSHWKQEDRLMLLDAAAELLKPINILVNKPKIKREVEKVPAKTELEDDD